MGKIFISHSSVNNAEALAIHDWLVEQGWGDVFLDLDPKRGLVAGDRWQAALKAAAEQCELILIMISPEWAKSRWCLAEFLLAKQMNKQILGVVVKPTPIEDLPVELTAEWQLVDLSAPDTGWSTTISPPRFEPETTVSFSGTGLARLRSGLEKAGLDATTFNWPPAHDLGRSPYRGLLPLDQDDAGIFFGRDGAIVLTLDALRGLRAGAAPRFATILGASGAGKSSFLRAGILPRLNRDSRHFYVLPIIRPERAALTGEHGFAAMIEAAFKARNITRNRADIRDAVKAGADTVAPLLRELAIPADAGDVGSAEPPTLVIAVDQAEELLTADNAEAGALLTLLAELGRRDDPPILVLFTVRSDSFDQLQSRPELAPTQPHHLIDLPPVPAGSFGDIIRGPARRVSAAGRKLHVDETLVDALLNDIEQGGTKDALPLLAFTLERLYTDYGADGDLQLAEYDRLGRIRGAIEAAVEQALTKADGDTRIPKDRAARLALLRRGLIPWLAGIDPNTGSPRRRVARLAEVPDEARPLIELMVEQRLLATDVDSTTKERTIEPAHEALLRQWGALDGWLAEDSADLATIEALRRAATEWEANARASEFVAHRGARLQAIEQVAGQDKFAAYLTSVDRAYLSAARNMENGAIKKARAARTRLAIAASVVGVVLVAGGTAGYFIWSAGEAAKTQAAVNFQMARAEAFLRDGRPEEASVAALSAYEILPSTTTRTAALETVMSVDSHATGLVDVEGRVVDARWTDATHLATLLADGTLTRFDAATGETSSQPVNVDTPPIGLVVSGPDLNIVYADASILAPDGTPVSVAPAEPFFARAGTVTASADGKVVGMLGLVGDALIRDCRSLPCVDRHLVDPDGAAYEALKISPSGQKLALLQSGNAVVFDALDAEPRTITITSSGGGDLDWSPDDNRFVFAQRLSEISVVDLTASLITNLDPHEREVSFVGWSPDGGMIAAACDRVLVCLYSLAELQGDEMRTTGARVATLPGHTDVIGMLRWSPDGKRLASVAAGEPIRLWSIEQDQRAAWVLQHDVGSRLTSLAVDRQRSLVAAGGMMSQLWLMGAELKPRRLGPETIVLNSPLISAAAFQSDGRVAAIHENRSVSVWSLDGDSRTPNKEIVLENASFSRLATPNGDVRVAVPMTNGEMLVLSGDDLRESTLPPEPGLLTPWGVTAAPEDNTVFISYSDGSIRRRNLGTGAASEVVFDASKPICGAEATTDNNGAKSLDVSDDGKWLAATRSDARIIVHNLADPSKPVCLSLLSPESKTVAFSPDSTRIAVLSATDRLYIFDLATPDDVLILGSSAVADGSPLSGTDLNTLRTTSWMDWYDSDTIAISTTAGAVAMLNLDPAAWRARVDSLTLTP